MNIQEVSFSLNDFDLCVAKLPQSDLKDALKSQVERMFNLLARETMAANRRAVRPVVSSKRVSVQAIAS